MKLSPGLPQSSLSSVLPTPLASLSNVTGWAGIAWKSNTDERMCGRNQGYRGWVKAWEKIPISEWKPETWYTRSSYVGWQCNNTVYSHLWICLCLAPTSCVFSPLLSSSAVTQLLLYITSVVSPLEEKWQLTCFSSFMIIFSCSWIWWFFISRTCFKLFRSFSKCRYGARSIYKIQQWYGYLSAFNASSALR